MLAKDQREMRPMTHQQPYMVAFEELSERRNVGFARGTLAIPKRCIYPMFEVEKERQNSVWHLLQGYIVPVLIVGGHELLVP